MLTNSKHSFMKSQSFETGVSDYHHMIYTIVKSANVKLPPKMIKYREYRNFQKEDFQRDLHTKLCETTHAYYQVLHSAIESVVQEHAPLKQRIVRGNHKPHVKAEMRKAIMKRTRLKKRANKTGKKKILRDIKNKEI